ncbi:4841_t:CDS:1, partial [Entrophospora sp. SA101]
GSRLDVFKATSNWAWIVNCKHATKILCCQRLGKRKSGGNRSTFNIYDNTFSGGAQIGNNNFNVEKKDHKE